MWEKVQMLYERVIQVNNRFKKGISASWSRYFCLETAVETKSWQRSGLLQTLGNSITKPWEAELHIDTSGVLLQKPKTELGATPRGL